MEGSRAGTYQVAYHVEGSSGDGLQRPRLDDHRESPDDPQPRLDEHMGCAIEDYERAIAAPSLDWGQLYEAPRRSK